MRAATGLLYLIDFGIARRFTPGQRRDTTVLGSSGYAPPEQYGTAQTTAQAREPWDIWRTLARLTSGEEWHGEVTGEVTPDLFVYAGYREYGDTAQAVLREAPAWEVDLQSTRSGADRRQEQWVKYRPGHYRE
jgi:serine/threonine protein kinase